MRQVDGDWGDPVEYGGTLYDGTTLYTFAGRETDDRWCTWPYYPVYAYEPIEEIESWMSIDSVRAYVGREESYDLTDEQDRIACALDVVSYWGFDNVGASKYTKHILAVYSMFRNAG